MLRTFLVAAALLGAVSDTHASPALGVSEGPAPKTVTVSDKHLKAVEASHPGVSEDSTRTLRVGDVDVVIPLLKGYRDLAGLPEMYRGMFERMIPDSMALLDVHLHVDHDTVDIHDISSFAQYEIYAVKVLKSRRMTPKEWGEFRAAVSTTLKSVDMSQLLKRNETRVNDTLGEYGVDELRIAEVRADTPVIYRSDDRSLRLIVTVSNQQTIEGKLYQIEEVRATANLFVNGKVVSLVAAREFRAGSAKPLEVVAALDVFADRVLALNP